MIPCNEFASLADFPRGAIVRSSAEYMQSALRRVALERGLGIVRATYYGGRYGSTPLVAVRWANGDVSSINPRWLARV